MLEKELEQRLKRYRPVGPPADLRASILEGAPAGRTWPWAAAAAVLLATTVLLRAASGGEVRNVGEPAPDVRSGAVADLAAALGGTPDAHVLAETLLIQEQIRAARVPVPGRSDLQ